ncbi:MAG: RNA polymerase-associated protein RapA [Nitrosomonas sp.]|nr:RNA polymerase-associated protein RapA [Nitrosomonas sp.]MDP1949848.1 RNA polymerase-associated protein RapA [Nitrosomonas sp.]
MNDFKPGQRWICDVDLQLGLGTVMAVEDRVVRISFMATGETRSYAKQSAPLTRVIFDVSDTVISHEGMALKVVSVSARDGLIVYTGINAAGDQTDLTEDRLAHHLQFNRPAERLFNGLVDRDKWFQVRYQTLLARNRLAESPLYGLIGTRTRLIPHQLYIANEVAHRYAPRVLLADEVGLGKTIEAGLILHQQLLTERVKRILIVVPETLVHQWLVEMLRRFNLHFSVFDETRCEVLEENDEQENPFHSEQLILCSIDFLNLHPEYFQMALEGDWDLLVVDEAHHLQWSEQVVSPEYAMIEQLAARTKGVLLLTATPEQLGKSSHFARLRLLDPDRFSSFTAFVAEEQSYEPIAQAVEALLGGQDLDNKISQIISATIQRTQAQKLLASLRNATIEAVENKRARAALAELLLDRHGTGRILFRNTRAAIKGFPDRKVTPAPLAIPSQYHDCLTRFETAPLSKPQGLLNPELLYQARAQPEDPLWTEIDPRINWLSNTLKQLKPEKVLVITANTQTTRDLAQVLKALTGQHIPVFHEYMSLVERDREAAFFANKDTGSQLLVCSEIGSEGRNFQFAHHLVLFDLPLNPDLLEQRIGRLDRIGQTEIINIYVPYIENSAQAVLFHWYHQGLNAFQKTCPAGQTVFPQVEAALNTALHQRATNPQALSELINTTRTINQTLNDALDRGRDKLLEYHSFRPEIGHGLKQLALAQDADPELLQYMDAVFDCFGVHIEAHRTGSYLIEPSEHMTTSFAGLNDEGTVITYTRDVALANEDMQFLTWEHPMVIHAMDRVLRSEIGNAVVSAIKHKGAKPGTLFLECLYILETGGNNIQQSNRYLPPTMIRILLDEQGKCDYPALNHELINRHHAPVAEEIARQIIQLKKESIKALISASERRAQAQVEEIISQAHLKTKQIFTLEIDRLKALRQVNPNVREEEIRFFEQQLDHLTQAFNSTKLRLDALRVIVAT